MKEGDIPKYQRIMNYNAWGKAVEVFDTSLPRRYWGTMDDLEDVFDLAAKNVNAVSSERSHLLNIMITTEDVDNKLPPYGELDRHQLRFLEVLNFAECEAWEVIEFGHAREEKKGLKAGERAVQRFLKRREQFFKKRRDQS